MALINTAYIEELTGFPACDIAPAIVDLAESRVKAELGYLRQETKEKIIYCFNAGTMFYLEDTGAVVTKVETRVASGDYTEQTSGWRHVAALGAIIFDGPLAEGTELKITFSIGWTMTTLPTLVKFLLALVTIETLNKFQPGAINLNTVESKRLGDYAVKYNISTNSESELTFDELVDKLVILIKQGTFEPTAKI